MDNKRNFDLYLEDMFMAQSRILEYTMDLDYNTFFFDNRTIDAVIRNFEILGEAANKIPEIVKCKYPNYPWDEMCFMRNKLAHEYFGIDLEIIWDVITNHLPATKNELAKIIKQEKTTQ